MKKLTPEMDEHLEEFGLVYKPLTVNSEELLKNIEDYKSKL